MSSAVCLLVCLLPLVVKGWWPFSSEISSESERASVDSLDHSRRAAQFEMMSAEQKFLSEAQQFLDLSPLDHCLHGVSENSYLLNYIGFHPENFIWGGRGSGTSTYGTPYNHFNDMLPPLPQMSIERQFETSMLRTQLRNGLIGRQ